MKLIFSRSSLLFLAILLTAAGQVSAADFGNVRLKSNLGQPFSAQLTVTHLTGNQLDTNCYQAKVLALDGTVLASPHLTGTRVHTDNQTAQLYFSANELINEPAVNFKVDMICQGARQREYTLLVDYADMAASVVANGADVVQDSNPAELAPVDKPVSHKQARTRPKTLKLALPNETAQSKRQTTQTQKMRFAMALSAPRDSLHISNQELATELTTSRPTDQASRTLEQQRQLENKAAQAAFAKLLRDEPAQLQNPDDLKNESQKVQGLEKEVAHLKLDLQVKTEHAQSVSNWLIILNLVVIALFILTIAVLIYLLKKARVNEKPHWWNAEPEPLAAGFEQGRQSEQSDPETEGMPPAPSAILEAQRGKSLEAAQDEAMAQYLSNLLPDEHGNEDPFGPTTLGLPFESVEGQSTILDPAKKSAEKFNLFANRELHSIHIEEVSDAMQEAQFWMSINDPVRAIEILEPHCTDDHPETPVMWLCLLDLYRTVGNEEKYEALRQRFRAQFNTNILPFNEKPDAKNIKHLEDFEHLIAKCCTFWHTSYMLPFLESLLVNDRTEERVGFDLSVYQDILLLMSICKELDRPEEAAA